MICSHCKSENRDGAKFCDECGRPLLPEIELAPECEGRAPEQEDAHIDADSTGELPDMKGATSPLMTDDRLVEPGYVPPKASWRSGDTMEMPRIGDGADAVPQRDFRAPDQNAKMQRRQQKREEKQRRAAEKQARKAEKKARKAEPRDSARDSKPPRRTGRLKAIIAIVVVLLTAAAAAALGLSYNLEAWGGKTVPDVVGMTQADAVYLLESKGFRVRETRVKSDETEGIVLMVDPSAGARVSVDSEVVIHVSQSRVVPEVIGLSRDEALAALKEEGFENISVEARKSDEPENLVVETSPAPGEKAKASALVTVTVTSPYLVPDISGMTWDEAVSALEAEGYEGVTEYVYDDSLAEGTVVGTNPESGEKLKSGSTVSILITKSRAAELVAATQEYLQGAGNITLDGVEYAIGSVDAVNYEGNDLTSFTITCSAVTVLDGETVYGSSKQKSGLITWGADNSILGIS